MIIQFTGPGRFKQISPLPHEYSSNFSIGILLSQINYNSLISLLVVVVPVIRVTIQELSEPNVDGETEIIVLLPETIPAKISNKNGKANFLKC